MLPKFFASWLVVLVIAPFTAPFSTCDLASLFGGAQDQHAPIAPRSAVASATDTAVPTALFVPNAGRVRLCSLGRVPLAELATPSAAATVIASAVSAGGVREHTVLRTILRI